MPGPLFSGSLIPSGIRTVYASFSGGADSLALLVSLAALREEGKWELRAVHFEHGIRGAESLADAEFCRDVCDKLGVPLQVVPLNVPDKVRPGEGTEAAARRLRQEAWQTILGETEKMPMAVALGHNADDRIESLFLRLMRGSNMSGLHALRAVREFDGIVWLRPLLVFSRVEIEAYLAGCGMNSFRTDSTNLENDYDRNRLRNVVLPALYREFPRARAGILTALRAIEEDVAALDNEAEQAFRLAVRPGGLELDSLAKMPPALLPRVLRLWLGGQIPDRHFIERLRDLLDAPDRAGSGRIPAENGEGFRWRNGLLRKADDEPAGPEDPDLWDYRKTPAVRFGRTVLRFRGAFSGGEMPSGSDAAVFDAETFPGRLRIAARQPGDAMTPFGSTYSVSLKKLFTDAHVSAAEQPLRPVVRDAAEPTEILWIPGVRRSSLYPLAADSGKPSRGLLFSSEPLVDVTAAVIGGPDGRILVCSRPAGTHMAGKWEFPGGKIEPEETPENCIRREIREELGMEIAVGPVLTVMEHDYGVKYVRVTFFLAVSDNAPAAKDGQEFRWVPSDGIGSVDFLDADRPVSEEIRKKSEKISAIYNKMRHENVKWLSKQP
ncbi:MAG: tRNA lysidine(34) synthetase TilS [Lentisphaeria bacterium]|nr:tRNA lysidine(34) synthetase TilS [Lentisphaeria bacterium]